MSGGYFEFLQYGIGDVAEAVDAYALRTDTDLSPETLARVRLAASTLRRAAHMLHCVDYLASADYGEESFAQEWGKQEVSADDSRREFEAWVSAEPYCKSLVRYPDDRSTAWPGAYKDINVHLAWDAWRTARGLGQEGES